MNTPFHRARHGSALLMLVLIGLCTFFCTGCGHPPGKGILGAWIPVPEVNHFRVQTIRFDDDGTFHFDQVAGKFEIKDGTRVTLIFPNVLPNTYDFEITKAGRLVLKDQAGIAGEFVRPD